MAEGWGEPQGGKAVPARVESVDGGMAVLLVGEDEVEQHLPADELPDGAVEGSVVLIRPVLGGWEAVGLDPLMTGTRPPRRWLPWRRR